MPIRSWRSLLLVALAAASAAAPLHATKLSPPTRPAAQQIAWNAVRLRGQDFVDLREVGTRLHWAVRWDASARRLSLTAGERTLVATADQRDCRLDGVRVFLSERVALHRDSLWVARVDLINTIAPLLRPAEQTLRLPAPSRLIVLDAGHGGSDPGKQNARHRLDEKDMTLDVVLRLRKLLVARGYRVALTREDDTRFANNPLIDLQRRADFSNKAVADLFISVHFNAVDPRDAQRVQGTETYVLTPPGMLSTSDERKDELTDRAFPGHRNGVANVLLGHHLHRQLVTDLGTSDRGFKRARFAVLRFVEAPAVLIEAAYLSHDAEAARVGTPEFRQQIAESIARGVDAYSAALLALQPSPI